MPKKVVKPIVNKKIISPKKHIASDFEKVLVSNFVSLQKVMTDLSVKFDNLTKQLSKLLELFEMSAKTLAEKELDLKQVGNKKVIEKIDNLLEQNKIIARGLTLIHSRIEGEEPEMPEQNIPPMQRPPQAIQPKGIEGYQKSISSQRPPQPQGMQFPKK